MEIEHQRGAFAGDPARAPRRVFIVPSEIPGLLFGAIRGEPVDLRRILGARGSGRWGIALAALALALAAPVQLLSPLLAIHAVASLVGWWAVGARAGLGLRSHQRLLLWYAALPLVAAAPLRWLTSGVWLAGVAGLAVGHVLLARHLMRERPFGPLASDPAPSPAGSSRPRR